jgi:antirestriction protein ArdC
MSAQLYEQITARIIAQLESGVVPWQSPYFSKVGFPRNFASGKAYQGINVFLLASLRYTSPWFLTFLQAKELGGFVRKGEKGSLVIKYGTYKKDEEPATDEETPQRCYLKGYTVFNASQIDGIALPEPEASPVLPVSARCDRARAMVAGMPNPPVFAEGSAIPCYRRRTDSVHLPERRYFTSEEAYYTTFFHELTHATGHASRLARKSLLENRGFDDDSAEGRKTYAEEELVAEMGAAFLSAHASIGETEIPNSAAYLQGWITALKTNDARGWIVRAASQAQKAANYILNLQPNAE